MDKIGTASNNRQRKRSLVFVSHANPEDNQIAEWLCLQLAREGYQVWSDVTDLIGGESFWTDIEQAIRENAAKFLFILTTTSNVKQGTLDELHLARTVAKAVGIKDFIIPLRADNISFDTLNVALHRLNVIDFTVGWAKGLASVFEKLDKDNVPRNSAQFNAGVVASWWAARRTGKSIVRNQPEECLSNWFQITELPENLLVHRLTSRNVRIDRQKNKLPFPAYPVRDTVVTFASAEELGLSVSSTTRVPISDCLSTNVGSHDREAAEQRNALIHLLRTAWRNYLALSGLPRHGLANNRECSYFKPSMFESKTYSFNVPGRISGRRSLVGQVKGRTWHFALSGDPQLEPLLSYVVKAHVLFSDDGAQIWNSKSRLHAMRRSACRDWWNDHWRDRLIAAVCWLAATHNTKDLIVPLTAAISFRVPLCPVSFTSPVSYDDSGISESCLDAPDEIEMEQESDDEGEE